LFNLFILYGYVQEAFHQATIIPLVFFAITSAVMNKVEYIKCKSGDLDDVNNYRAIALSNAITKILDFLLFSFVDSHDNTDEYQCGVLRKTTQQPIVLISLRIVNY